MYDLPLTNPGFPALIALCGRCGLCSCSYILRLDHGPSSGVLLIVLELVQIHCTNNTQLNRWYVYTVTFWSLTSILFPAAPTIDSTSCKALTQLLLDDLQTVIVDATPNRLSREGTPTPQRLIQLCPDPYLLIVDALPALSAVKSLGRTPYGAQVLASALNLKCLMTLTTKLATTPEASNEALKCVANTLLLSEVARTRLLSEDVDGGNISIDLLEV